MSLPKLCTDTLEGMPWRTGEKAGPRYVMVKQSGYALDPYELVHFPEGNRIGIYFWASIVLTGKSYSHRRTTILGSEFSGPLLELRWVLVYGQSDKPITSTPRNERGERIKIDTLK